ncbi:MAG TPA: YlxR family protein [Candidatus Limnocylindria bacterium]|nr:YlxR family protein [Candidatus Limnocylindria bacterium]
MRRTERSSEARRSGSVAKASQRPPRSLPQRTCVACRTTRPKRELVRVVRSPLGELSVDLRGKAPGRGAYLDPDAGCLERGLTEGALSRALETPIDDGAAAKLREQLAAAAKERRANA